MERRYLIEVTNFAPVDIEILQVDLKICGEKMIHVPKIQRYCVGHGQVKQKYKCRVFGKLHAHRKYDHIGDGANYNQCGVVSANYLDSFDHFIEFVRVFRLNLFLTPKNE